MAKFLRFLGWAKSVWGLERLQLARAGDVMRGQKPYYIICDRWTITTTIFLARVTENMWWWKYVCMELKCSPSNEFTIVEVSICSEKENLSNSSPLQSPLDRIVDNRRVNILRTQEELFLSSLLLWSATFHDWTSNKLTCWMCNNGDYLPLKEWDGVGVCCVILCCAEWKVVSMLVAVKRSIGEIVQSRRRPLLARTKRTGYYN